MDNTSLYAVFVCVCVVHCTSFFLIFHPFLSWEKKKVEIMTKKYIYVYIFNANVSFSFSLLLSH